ncbi:hypothetical protein KBD08_00625 [Candidatus Babeliales bacterium]|nr:hypothetical protein [Candidatus Babeliales bacterium]
MVLYTSDTSSNMAVVAYDLHRKSEIFLLPPDTYQATTDTIIPYVMPNDQYVAQKRCLDNEMSGIELDLFIDDCRQTISKELEQHALELRKKT